MIEKLRTAAKQNFHSLAGAPSRLEGEVKSTIDPKGGTCIISFADDDSSAKHECTWVLSKDPAAAKSIYDRLVAETAACVLSKEPPARHQSNRSENASFDDIANSSVSIRYYFDSGWYLLEVDYDISRQ